MPEQSRTFGSFLCGTLPSIFYWPDYVSEFEADGLLSQIRASRTPWTHVSGRRLQALGGHVHERSGSLVPAPLPTWARPILARLEADTGLFTEGPPNHILLNHYPASGGILPHEDGPLYFPVVCILSLGSPTVMHFTAKRDCKCPNDLPESVAVTLKPRSLLVFKDEAYTAYLHGIEEGDTDAVGPEVVNAESLTKEELDGGSLARSGDRFSLTIRRVRKTQKPLIRLSGGR
eukprot:jgi/Botrbrau1/10024/Bobra.0012s0111.1